MSEQHYLAGEGALWIQPSGKNTQPQYLGCHLLGDVDEPQGDLTLVYCPDPSAPNRFKVVTSYQGTPGAVTTSIETDIGKVADWLEAVRCPVPVYVHKISCGRVDVWGNYDRSFILTNAYITSKGLSGLVAKTPDDQGASTQKFELSAESVLRVFKLSAARQATSQTRPLNDVAFCNDERCGGPCGAGAALGDVGLAATDATGGSALGTADVDFTENGGSDWAAGADDPFTTSEDISSVACFYVGAGTLRRIVARGTTDGGNPMEIAYSDDDGASWTLVDVGDTNGQYAVDAGALFALDLYHIWLATSGGYIYFSEDGGVTWTSQEEGVVTVQDLHSVHFADVNYGWAGGAANALLKTSDGGATWEAVTGPSAQAGVVINAVFTIDANTAWVAYNDGDLYFTIDGGTNWTRRQLPGVSGGAVVDVDFIEGGQMGMAVHNTAGPVGTLFLTINGGYDWEAITTPTNAGLNAVDMLSPTLAYAVGELQAGTAVIVKVSAA